MKSTCHNAPIKHYENGCYCSVCLTEQLVPKSRTWLRYAVIPIILLISGLSVKAPALTNIIGIYGFYPASPDDIIPTDSSVLEELVKHKCVLASVAVAQARIESGNYTSDMALFNKNLFGIKVHDCKYVTGERNGHATFATYKDNIACYCKIQQKYLDKIHKSYAQDSLYCQKIKQMK